MTESEASELLVHIYNIYGRKISENFKDNAIRDTFELAIKALEKLEKIKRVLDTTCLSDDVTKCYYDGDCRIHEYKEIVKIVRSDEE